MRGRHDPPPVRLGEMAPRRPVRTISEDPLEPEAVAPAWLPAWLPAGLAEAAAERGDAAVVGRRSQWGQLPKLGLTAIERPVESDAPGSHAPGSHAPGPHATMRSGARPRVRAVDAPHREVRRGGSARTNRYF